MLTKGRNTPYDGYKLYGETYLTIMGGNVTYEKVRDIASKFFNHPVGRLEKGAFGDVILIDYSNPTKLNSGNFPWQLHFGISTAGVKHVFVGGKEIYNNGKSTIVNENEIYNLLIKN